MTKRFDVAAEADRLGITAHQPATTGRGTLLEMRRITRSLHCDCYDPDHLEYDPNRICARCQLLRMLDTMLRRRAS